jgi:hypothetical protein
MCPALSLAWTGRARLSAGGLRYPSSLVSAGGVIGLHGKLCQSGSSLATARFTYYRRRAQSLSRLAPAAHLLASLGMVSAHSGEDAVDDQVYKTVVDLLT